MSFIREIDRDEASPKLEQLYDLMSTEDGEVFNVAKIWGLFPSIMESWMQFYESIMEEDHALSRARKEMIAVRVSELNECEYWTEHHGEFLRAQVEDDRIVAALKAGQPSDPELFSAAEQEMFAFLETLTLDPSAVREEDVESLRSAGFDDPEILEIVTVAGYFNLMNRMSDGLGVELEDWYQQAEQ